MRWVTNTRAPGWLGGLFVLVGLTVGTRASAETLTAEEALTQAAQNNPSLRAAIKDVEAARLATLAEDNGRVPTLNAALSGQYSESLSSDATGGSRSDTEGLNGSAAVKYTTDIGTAIEVGLESAVSWRGLTGTAGSAFGPLSMSDVYFTARQPMLRGAGRDANLAALELARTSETSVSVQRDQTASQTAHDVLGAYWDLWYATEAEAVQVEALAVAKKQLADAKAKAETLGTGTRIDVLQFASSAASIEDALSQARAQKRAAAIELGRLLGRTPESSLSLSATKEPTLLSGPLASDVAKRLEERSFALAAARADLKAAEVRVTSAEDADQLRLDAFTTVSMGVMWANDDLPGLTLPGGRPAFTVLAGLELEVPLGESRQSADAARARTQLAAAKDRYQAERDSVRAQVATLGQNLSAADEQVRLAGETASLSEELAQAERDRFSLGTNSSSDVVKAEQSAREAELRKLKAVAGRVAARLDLEHAAGTLLDRVSAGFGSGGAK